ncbi:bifunctional nicotinamidase/pyrazinamidase [bacterium]|nr:bifunctional nicotinamidase/pyrazinamidase [bacterium]
MVANAFIITDLQYDFMPGGALAVPEGDLLVPIANRLMPLFEMVIATQDWHPPSHGSFASSHPGKKPGDVIDLGGLPQILWPDHCVQGTRGAELHHDLNRAGIHNIFRKGTDPAIDSYSALFDNGRRKSTGLGEYLKVQGARDLYICGLTTDYCVKFSALDAVRMGFKMHLIHDACRPVNLDPGDEARAIEELKQAGVEVVTASDFENWKLRE